MDSVQASKGDLESNTKTLARYVFPQRRALAPEAKGVESVGGSLLGIFLNTVVGDGCFLSIPVDVILVCAADPHEGVAAR